MDKLLINRNINTLNPNSDKNEICLYIISTCLKVQVMRIRKVISKDEMSWYQDKFSLLDSYELYREQ